jgi:hypothetical protein
MAVRLHHVNDVLPTIYDILGKGGYGDCLT